jgi:hypothetical protein
MYPLAKSQAPGFSTRPRKLSGFGAVRGTVRGLYGEVIVIVDAFYRFTPVFDDLRA